MKIFILHRQISDQYGTSEVVGIYSTEQLAREANANLPRERTSIEVAELDDPPRCARWRKAVYL